MKCGEVIHAWTTPSARLIIALLTFGLAFNIWIAALNRAGWGLDFNQFYSGSRLAGTGHLYDWDALRKIELENGHEVAPARLPVVFFGHKLFGRLPYVVARSVWLAISISALIFYAAVWPGTRRVSMMVALAWSMPATLVLLFGQDVPLWLMFFTIGLISIGKKRPWIAGIAFSLCICKFNLAVGIPIMFSGSETLEDFDQWRRSYFGVDRILLSH